MFCRKCGKQLADTDVFCSSCGMSTNAQVQPAQSKPANNEAFANGAAAINSAVRSLTTKGTYTVISIGASILFIILLLAKWLKVPMLQYVSTLFGGSSNTGSYSILKLLISLKGIVKNGYLSGSGRVVMVLFILIITVLMVLSIYYLGKYIYGYFSKNEINTGKFQLGLNCIIVLFAVCFIGMLIINATVSSKTYGLYSEALSLTGVAYFSGVAAILARFILVKKLNEEIKLTSNNTAKDSISKMM